MLRAARLGAVIVTAGMCLLLNSGLATAGKKPLVGIPLLFRPTDPKELAAVKPADLRPVRIGFITFVERREKPDLIGENREDEDKGKILPVTTSSNVAEFCESHMSDLFRQLGVFVVKDDWDVSVAADVVEFQVMERDRYVGTVRLNVDLSDKNRRVLWSGVALGTSSHWGRSYKAVNYYETLSDSLVSATVNLLNDSDFRRALRSGK
jgi:hypothetical protein